MRLINLTPHAVNLIASEAITLPPSGVVARCAVERTQVGTIEVDGIEIPVNKTSFGEVTGLPKPVEGIIYIVSALVAQAAKRDDVLMVDDTVRDEQGRIIGARALARA